MAARARRQLPTGTLGQSRLILFTLFRLPNTTRQPENQSTPLFCVGCVALPRTVYPHPTRAPHDHPTQSPPPQHQILRPTPRTHDPRPTKSHRRQLGNHRHQLSGCPARLNHHLQPPQPQSPRNRLRHGRCHRPNRSMAARHRLSRHRRTRPRRRQPMQTHRRAKHHQHPRHAPRCRRSRRKNVARQQPRRHPHLFPRPVAQKTPQQTPSHPSPIYRQTAAQTQKQRLHPPSHRLGRIRPANARRAAKFPRTAHQHRHRLRPHPQLPP